MWFYDIIAQERECTTKLEKIMSSQSKTTVKQAMVIQRLAPPNFFRHSGTRAAAHAPNGELDELTLDLADGQAHQEDGVVDDATSHPPATTRDAGLWIILASTTAAAPSPPHGQMRGFLSLSSSLDNAY